MASMLRWTQAQLDEYLNKRSSSSQVTKPSPSSAATGSPQASASQVVSSGTRPAKKANSAKLRAEDFAGLPSVDAHLGKSKKAGKSAADNNTRTASRRHALDSLLSATISGTHERGKYLELRFEGAKLLSVNRLYGLTHFERIKYRKAWHQKVRDAVQLVVGGPRHLQTFDHFIIRSHRISVRKADTDAKSSYLKYVIDGLRYANAIVDDREEFFRDLLGTEARGPAALVIRIEQVPKSYVPIAERSDWSRAIMSLDDDGGSTEEQG